MPQHEDRADRDPRAARRPQDTRRVEYLAALVEVNRTLTSTLDYHEVAHAVLDAAQTLLPGCGSYLWEVVPETGALRAIATRGFTGGGGPQPKLRLGEGAAGMVAETQERVIIGDLRQDDRVRFKEWMAAEGLVSGIFLPLLHTGTVYGTLSLFTRSRHEFDDEEIRLLESFASQAAAAVANARMYAQSEARRRAAEALAAVGRHLSETLDPGMVAQDIADSIRDLCATEVSVLYRLESDSGNLVAAALSGNAEAVRWITRVLPPGTGTAGLAVRERRAMVTSNLLTDSRVLLTPEIRSRIEHTTHRSRLAIPLLVQDRVIGALVAGDGEGRLFGPEAINLAQTFADQAALAFENARLHDETVRRGREAEILADLARDINASLELGRVLERVAEGARDLCQSDMAMIALRDSESDAMVVRHRAGSHTDAHVGRRIDPGKGVGGQVLVTGRPFRTDDYGRDPRIAKDGPTWGAPERGVASMAVPITIGERIEGLLYAQNRSHRPFTDQDETILSRLAAHAAIAIGNARSFAREQDARALAQASEARFRLLFHDNPLPMWVYDVETLEFVEVNDAAIAHYGYSREEFLRMRIADVHPPEDAGQLLETFAGASEGASSLRRSGRWRHRVKDGRIIDVETVSHRLVWAGRATALVVAQDVTERRTLEAQLRQAQKMEAVGQLAGGIAHDFNNLLTVISGRSDMLLRGALVSEGTARHYVEMIHAAAERAAALTQQLLAFSRKQVLRPRVLDLNAVVRNLEAMLRRLIGENIHLVTLLEPELGRIKADPGQIEQVIVNLVVNARDAMPRGGWLTLATANVELDAAFARQHVGASAGAHVEVSITDSGIGMDERTVSRIFEPFFTTKEPGKGTGLGLATVYGIVRQSGGHITVDSEPGRGTTFTIHFPRTEDAAAPVEAHLPPPAVGSESILILEDDKAVRDLALEVLTAHGYAVRVASLPSEALRIAAATAGSLHLLLTDVVMPEMSGRQLAEQLLALRPDVRVLYISGYTDAEIARHGVLEPGTALLAKPFSPDALARKVRDVLDSA